MIRVIVFGLMLIGLGGFGATAAAETHYVSAANGLNCRSEPNASAAVIEKLQRGTGVSILRRETGWARIETPADNRCWASTQFLSADASTFSSAAYYSDRSARGKARQRYSSAGSGKAQKKSRQSPAANSGGNCPCRGNNVCIGPRGGRYCITSGGNKRYGV